jgi:hypothetical protein
VSAFGVIFLGLVLWLAGGMWIFVHGFGGGWRKSWPLAAIFAACVFGILVITGAASLPSVTLEWR